MSKPRRAARKPLAKKPVSKRKKPTAARKTAQKTVDGYVKKLPAPMQLIVNRIRALVAIAAPEAIETLKWAQPVYEVNGPFAYIKAHRNHVNFGFWRGALLEAPAGALEGDGTRMRHQKIVSLAELQEDVLKTLVRQAVLLNERLGTPD